MTERDGAQTGASGLSGRPIDYRLNAILDASLIKDTDEDGAEKLAALAIAAVRGGTTILQYRDKTGSTRRMVDNACIILRAIAGSGVPLVINDRVDVALAAGADGVHLGAEDMEIETARRLLGPGAIIGMTVKRPAEAQAAGNAPIDYACIGGVFETLSKRNPDPPVGLDGFAGMRALIRSADHACLSEPLPASRRSVCRRWWRRGPMAWRRSRRFSERRMLRLPPARCGWRWIRPGEG